MPARPPARPGPGLEPSLAGIILESQSICAAELADALGCGLEGREVDLPDPVWADRLRHTVLVPMTRSILAAVLS